jgi:hypothetical protein
MLVPGGHVHEAVWHWLLAGGSSSGSGSHAWLAAGVDGMWRTFFDCSGMQHSSSHQPQPVHATASDYATWRVASDAWLRMMLCCGGELQQQLGASVADLEARVEQAGSRSYLPAGLVDKVLIMLVQLLDAAAAASQAGQRAGLQQQQGQQQAPSALAAAALQLCAGPASCQLARLLHDYRACYHDGSCVAAAGSAGVPPLGLSAAAWQTAARAEAAAEATAAAAMLLAQQVAPTECCADTDSEDSDAQGGPVLGSVLPRLLQLLGQMAAAGQALAMTPLPAADSTAGADDDTGERAAAAAAVASEQARASAVRVLRHISAGLATAVTLVPCSDVSRVLAAAALDPAAWLHALLREAQAAADAVACWQARLAQLRTAGDPMQGRLEGVDWAAMDAVLTLAAAHQPSTHGGCAAAAAAACSAGAPPADARLPQGVLQQQVVVAVFAQGLDALQWSSADALLHVLRCLRRVWALVVGDTQLQAAVAEALSARGSLQAIGSSDGSINGAQPLLVPLAATLAHHLLNALHSSKQRLLLVCSSLVHCLLLPELMLVGRRATPSSALPHLVQLHAGPQAPLRCFVAELLQCGSKGSPMLHLVVALRLAACIPLAPVLLTWYQGELLRLILHGVSMDPGAEAAVRRGRVRRKTRAAVVTSCCRPPFLLHAHLPAWPAAVLVCCVLAVCPGRGGGCHGVVAAVGAT